MIIGFAGMTHLGINTAVATAERGWKVIGFDESIETINNLQKSQLSINEPNLDLFFEKNHERLSFTNNINELSVCDIIYIAKDVPTNNSGESNLEPINSLINKVKSIIHQEVNLVILCQVPPGYTRSINIENNENIFYQVETLIFGNAMDRALYPERFIIGCSNKNDVIPKKYEELLLSFSCPIIKMSFESAELTKIAINFFLVSSITTSNLLAEVSEEIGADWFDIIPALQLDKRIGQFSYIKPGLGISGGNLERDLATILKITNKKNINSDLIKSWIDNSKYRKKWCWKILNKFVLSSNKDPCISVLGLAYKENTNSIKNSPALDLLEKIKDKKVRTHDPAVDQNKIKYGKFFKTIDECIKHADVVIISTPWEEYKKFDLVKLKKEMNGNIIIDPFRTLDSDHAVKLGFEYHTLGK